MHDLAACADLCESHGFAAPAAVLRALAEGKPPFYLVRAAMEARYASEEGFDEDDIDPPTRRLFRDRASAERYAQVLTARALRNYRPGLHGTASSLSDADFVREVGAILGTAYELPEDEGLLFPETATDEQMRRLSALLYLTPFEVAEFRTGPIE